MQRVGVPHANGSVVLVNPLLELCSVSEGTGHFFARWHLGPTGPYGVPETIVNRLRAVVAQMRARDMFSAAELCTQTLSMHVSALHADDGSRWYSAVFAVFATRDPLTLAVRNFRLTNRESQVLDLILRGLAAREIAALLGVSHLTVDEHCRRLRQKTGARSTTAMAASLLNGALWRSATRIVQHAG